MLVSIIIKTIAAAFPSVRRFGILVSLVLCLLSRGVSGVCWSDALLLLSCTCNLQFSIIVDYVRLPDRSSKRNENDSQEQSISCCVALSSRILTSCRRLRSTLRQRNATTVRSA